MTIEAWNLVLNVTIGVLVTGYGIWLKSVIDQQLRSKDTAIQALEAALKSKDAEISVLRADTAPAITQAYTTMRQHANQVTEESLRLTEELNRSKAKAETAPLIRLLGEARGLLAGASIIEKNLGTVIFPGKQAPEFSAETLIAFATAFLATQNAINAEVSTKTEKVKEMKATIPGMNP